jgi:Flp pilus assembly protein TadG
MTARTGTGAHGKRRSCSGSVLVEFAVAGPVMCLLLFSISEFGLMFRTLVQLNGVAREAGRAASAGESETRIRERVQASMTGNLDYSKLAIALTHRAYQGNGVWDSAWTTLTSTGNYNDAPPNAQIKVTFRYNYRLLVPGLFSQLVDNPAQGTKALTIAYTVPRG